MMQLILQALNCLDEKIAGCICFIVLTFSISVSAQNADINILKSINASGSNFKDHFFKTTSNSVAVINIAAPVSLFTASLIGHDKNLRNQSLYMAGAYLISTGITQSLKRIVKRERPFEKYNFIIQRTHTDSYSFPSGHSSSAFNTATSLSIVFPKWYVIVPSYAWATAVAYGRMYQGVHYPSDVLAGAVIGAGSAWLSFKIQHWIDKKKTTEQSKAVSFAL